MNLINNGDGRYYGGQAVENNKQEKVKSKTDFRFRRTHIIIMFSRIFNNNNFSYKNKYRDY